MISLRISRYRSPPIPDSVWPQMSIGFIVTGPGNEPPEMSRRSPLRFLAGLFATAFRPCRSLQLTVAATRSSCNTQSLQHAVVALRYRLSIYQRTGCRPRIASAGPTRREAQTGPRRAARRPPETGSPRTARTASFNLLFSNPETRLGAGSAGPIGTIEPTPNQGSGLAPPKLKTL